MTNQLIPVFAGEMAGASVQLCDARLLHSFLEVARDFSTWIKDRIEEYKFTLNIDYLEFSPKSGKKGRPSVEYHLTIDMAKELSMVERNEKGRQARRYFIEMERIAHQSRYGLVELPKAPRAKFAVPGGLTLEQQDAINDMIAERVAQLPLELQGGAVMNLRSALVSKYDLKGVKHGYKNIPTEHFTHALNLLARIELGNDNFVTLPKSELAALVDERAKAITGELLEAPKPDQQLTRSEVEAMINERMKTPALPAKLAHTGQRLRFSIDANLDFDGIIDGLERYGYRVIKVRDNAGLLM